jgi:transcription termination factor Rho
MTDEQEPTDPRVVPEDISAEPPAKKAARKTAKKAARKTAKKAAKKAVKKAAKKTVKKKAARKAAKKVSAILADEAPELPFEIETETEKNLDPEPFGLDEATAAELAAAEAAEAAAKAAAVARKAAEKAARAVLEAKKKVAAKKAAIAKSKNEEEADEIVVIEENQPAAEKAATENPEKAGEKTKAEEPGSLRRSGKSDESDRPEPKKEEVPPPPPPEVPDEIDLNEFRNEPLADLYDEVERLPVRIPSRVTRAQLVYTILTCYATHGTKVVGEGILEYSGGNFGMLRDEIRSFRSSPDDLHVSLELIKEYDLREGQKLKIVVREPRHRDKFLSVKTIVEIDGCPIENYKQATHFDALTSLFPEERFVLEGGDDGAGLATRVVDLVAPLGKGQRGLIVAPPRGGKTILLKQIAKAIQINSPDAELVVLLLDERPEEVTDFEEMIGRNVFASTFDEPSKRHAEVANLVLERSRRLVEQGRDVVILLDSLTRLARGYNNAARGGPIGSGGISPKAITETRKFFGAARNLEEGGSLTILATCLIETESRMDDVIFEELKGTGNMEVRLDRELAEQRIYPAIHIPQSGTRNDDRLYHPDELRRVQEIRRHLASLPIGEAIETLLRNLARTKTNTELLLQGMR